MRSCLLFLAGTLIATLLAAVDGCPVNCKCSQANVKCHGYNSMPQQFRSFSIIKVFDMSNNNLTSLSKSDLEKYVNVERLHLDGNSIAIIQKGTFSSHTRLNEIHISTNKLESIEDGVFCNMTSLTTLILSNNHISNLSLDVFHNVPNLQRLDLSLNRIYSFSSCSLILPSLRYLNLDNNSLAMVPSHIFNCTPHLQTLRLNLNRIQRLQKYSFSNVPNIYSVSLDNNLIRILDIETFQVKHQDLNTLLECKIKVFSIEGNLLTEVPMALNDLVYVVHLDISNNNIRTIQTLAFDRLKCLRYLRISEMPLLSKVGVDAFGGLNLRDIFMTRNPMLKELPGNLLQNMDELRTVVLNNNGLVTLPKSLCNWQQIMDVMLNDNNFICSCSNSWLQSYRGWDTPQTQQHVKKLKCHRPNNPEDFLIKDYDFSRHYCMKFGSSVSDKSQVRVELIAAIIMLLTLSVILFVCYRMQLVFWCRQFKCKHHVDHVDSTITKKPKYSHLSRDGDLN
uniref:Slit-like protein 3 protein n=1 Tax=Magallana gigas TaxID=29159 RepID=K1R787_MAGGI|eukprot:XP_019926508.1 PREDICTED: leucine-rich repeat-containing protein 15 [Crassostrea gigas]